MGILSKFARDRRGATAIEYGLIAALIVIAIIASLTSFAGATRRMYNGVSDNVSAVM